MLKETNIILVCGGSCSGKTTLAKGLVKAMDKFGSVEIISMDDYYYDLSAWDPAEADNKNFDSPEALDCDLLFQHLLNLQAGGKVARRRYNFKSHRITVLNEYIKAADFIIIEGIFALYFEKLRDLAAVRIFVHADADIRLARRVERDVAHRHLPLETVIRQYLQDVRPMHAKYIEAYSEYADLLLDSNFTTVGANLGKALKFLREKLAV